MEELEIRKVQKDELPAFFQTLAYAFSEEPLPVKEATPRRHAAHDYGRFFATYDGSEIVGTSGYFEFTTTIPGGELPCAGVTMIGVLPTHRRRGVMSNMMMKMFEDARDQGRPIATLWASEEAIYRRFGYGMTTLETWIDIEPHRATFRDRPPAIGRTRLLDKKEASKILPDVYEQVRALTPGMNARNDEWWKWSTLYDGKESREGRGPLFMALWENEGRPEAYALYRIKTKWVEGDSFGSHDVEATEVIATSTVGAREIWRFLFGIDLVGRVKGRTGPGAHPLFLMLDEPRRARARVSDGIWLRLLDIGQALEARTYAAEDELLIDVVDRVCPWNSGVWQVAWGGTPEASKKRAKPDLRVDVADLASVYFGGFTWAQLMLAGRCKQLRPGAVARADAMFATEVAPWCPEIF